MKEPSFNKPNKSSFTNESSLNINTKFEDLPRTC